jgi:tetratricopeptide (TPR) repeat protein
MRFGIIAEFVPMLRKSSLSLICSLLALAIAGCGPNKKDPTAREQANREWNSARANVLGSLATDQYKSGNLDKARETLHEALKLMPDSAPLHILSAKVAIESGQVELAEQELKLAREHAPNDAEAYYLSGVVYQRWQKPQTAYEFYKQAYERSPAELPYLLAESEMLVAMDRMPEAMELLQGKVTYFEHSGAIRDAVGQMLMQSGHAKEAATMFREASILSENEAAIRERLALALYADKNYLECSEVLSRLVQDAPYNKRADLFAILGDCQLQANHTREARMTFETATQLDPYSVNAWQSLGRAAMESGDLKRADLSLTHAIALDHTRAETHLLLGYVRVRQNRFQDALTSFQKAAALEPGDTVTLCMVGYALEKLGRSGEALQYYSRALRIKPGDEMASQLMAGIDLHDHKE